MTGRRGPASQAGPPAYSKFATLQASEINMRGATLLAVNVSPSPSMSEIRRCDIRRPVIESTADNRLPTVPLAGLTVM